MIPIPRAAMEVVRKLRKDVPRPPLDPVSENWTHGWRRPHPHCSPNEHVLTCPMGLHPKSTDCLPSAGIESGDYEDFPAKAKAIMAFAKWWDQYPAARINEAIDQIWPPRKRRSRKPKESSCPVESAPPSSNSTTQPTPSAVPASP